MASGRHVTVSSGWGPPGCRQQAVLHVRLDERPWFSGWACGGSDVGRVVVTNQRHWRCGPRPDLGAAAAEALAGAQWASSVRLGLGCPWWVRLLEGPSPGGSVSLEGPSPGGSVSVAGPSPGGSVSPEGQHPWRIGVPGRCVSLAGPSLKPHVALHHGRRCWCQVALPR